MILLHGACISYNNLSEIIIHAYIACMYKYQPGSYTEHKRTPQNLQFRSPEWLEAASMLIFVCITDHCSDYPD